MSSSVDHGVLVVTVHQDPCRSGETPLFTRIGDLVSAHRPAAVVVVLDRPASAGAALSVVLRVHGLCSGLGILMSVATGSAPARRALHAAADRTGVRLVVHARRHTAVTGTAFAAAA